MKQPPLVSYIVPCFNNESFVRDCLESIKEQRVSYPNIEIIFVDDGSTDKSGAYAHRCLDDTKGDLVITLKENKGVGHALNVGFDWARGDYLCFFAADDILIDPDKTYYQQMLMESTGADISYYLDWYEGKDKTNMRRVSGKWSPNYLPIGYFLKNFLHMSRHLFHWYLMHHDPINSGSFMITRKAYQKYGKWNERVLTTDYDLLLRYCRMGAKFLPLKGAPMFYRVHDGQSSNRIVEMAVGIVESRKVNQ